MRFEDARPRGKIAEQEPWQPRPLYSPRPTFYQHYLGQRQWHKGTGTVLHWDDDGAEIRGHKLYWRRNLGDDGWRKRDGDPEPTGGSAQRQKIKPLVTDSSFGGRI